MILLELAWAAGFFDGEGSVGCYMTENGANYRSPRPMIQIAQTDPEVLERFRDAVGVGRRSASANRRWARHRANKEMVH